MIRPLRCRDIAKVLAELHVLAELLCKNMAGAQHRVRDRGNLFVGIGKVLGPDVQLLAAHRCGENLTGQELPSPAIGPWWQEFASSA